MADTQTDSIMLRDISKPLGQDILRDVSDQDLLARFLACRDEAAFGGLVHRYGSVVWGICRRLLRREQDVEDAFQAVFFILARKAGSIRKGEAVGSWLYGVAYRTAMKSRRSANRRRKHETNAAVGTPALSPCMAAAWRDAQRVLDEEVERLAEPYRAPFILCCLEGMSRAEAARELGWKEGTLSGRLAQARLRLQKRLALRGVTLSAVLTAAVLAKNPAAAAVPSALLQSTAQAVLVPHAGNATGVALSPSARNLANGMLRDMATSKVTKAILFVVALPLFVLGTIVASEQVTPPSKEMVFQPRPWPADWPAPDSKTAVEGDVADNIPVHAVLAPDAPSELKPTRVYRQQYYHSFEGNPEKGPGIELFGLDAEQGVRFEPHGLRITLPPGYQDERPRTGVVTAFGVKGDFEITVGFEILQEPLPADTLKQTRFTLALPQEGPHQNMVTLSRIVAPQAGTQFLTSMNLWDPSAGRSNQLANAFPTSGKTGRLRLVREGAHLSYYASEGLTKEFVFLQQHPFNGKDVKNVRLVGTTGGPNAGLQVRVIDLSVRADSLPELTLGFLGSPGWKPWSAVAVALLFSIGLTAFLWLCSRSSHWAPRSRKVEQEAGTIEATTVFLLCSACGKKLAAKSESAGKQVKCPECGTVLNVPTSPPARSPLPDRNRWLFRAVVLATLLVSGAIAFVLYSAARRVTQPLEDHDRVQSDFIDRPFGAQPTAEIKEEGLWSTEFTKNSGEPFRWTNGAAKLTVPLLDRRPRSLRVRLGVPIPRPVGRLCIKVNGQPLFDEPVEMPFEWSHSFDLSEMKLGNEAVIEVISNTFVPAQHDQRTLGVCVRGITLLAHTNE